MSKKNNTIRHLIECNCVLNPMSQKKIDNFIYHKFVVFSVLDEKDNVIPKHVKCNNCGVIHKITDACVSEISLGEDEAKNIIEKEDIKFMLPTKLINILEKYMCDLHVWEEVLYNYQNKVWEKDIIISSEFTKNYEKRMGKILTLKSENEFFIKPFESDELFYL